MSKLVQVAGAAQLACEIVGEDVVKRHHPGILLPFANLVRYPGLSICGADFEEVSQLAGEPNERTRLSQKAGKSFGHLGGAPLKITDTDHRHQRVLIVDHQSLGKSVAHQVYVGLAICLIVYLNAQRQAQQQVSVVQAPSALPQMEVQEPSGHVAVLEHHAQVVGSLDARVVLKSG